MGTQAELHGKRSEATGGGFIGGRIEIVGEDLGKDASDLVSDTE